MANFVEFVTGDDGSSRTWVFDLKGDLKPVELKPDVQKTKKSITQNADGSVVVSETRSMTIKSLAVMHLGLHGSSLIAMFHADTGSTNAKKIVTALVAKMNFEAVISNPLPLDMVHLAKFGFFADDNNFMPASGTEIVAILDRLAVALPSSAMERWQERTLSSSINWLSEPPAKLLVRLCPKMHIQRRIEYVRGMSGLSFLP